MRRKGLIWKSIVVGILFLSIVSAAVSASSPPQYPPLSVSAELSSSGAGDTVISGGNLLYDANKNDTTNPYRITCDMTLDLQSFWGTHDLVNMISSSNPMWEKVYFNFGFSTLLDTNLVDVDESELTIAAVQAKFSAMNVHGGDFADAVRVRTVTYNSATGKLEIIASFESSPGVFNVDKADFDLIISRPTFLTLGTPDNAISIKQSNYTNGQGHVSQSSHIDVYMGASYTHSQLGVIPNIHYGVASLIQEASFGMQIIPLATTAPTTIVQTTTPPTTNAATTLPTTIAATTTSLPGGPTTATTGTSMTGTGTQGSVGSSQMTSTSQGTTVASTIALTTPSSDAGTVVGTTASVSNTTKASVTPKTGDDSIGMYGLLVAGVLLSGVVSMKIMRRKKSS